MCKVDGNCVDRQMVLYREWFCTTEQMCKVRRINFVEGIFEVSADAKDNKLYFANNKVLGNPELSACLPLRI